MTKILLFLIDRFPDLLDVSLTASIVILFVIIARLLLKRAPKIFSYALWSVVLLRLLLPISIESPVSFVPERQEFSGAVNVNAVLPEIPFDTTQDRNDDAWREQNALPGEPLVQTAHSISPQTYLTYIWIAGMGFMLLHSAVSYCLLRRKLKVVIPYRKGIYIADDIGTPFVMGLLRPVIYLPGALAPEERKYIIAHERHHIRRGDHLFKALGFLALMVHWFNPLIWVAFVLAGRDMEMSCDEAVIRKLGEDIRAEYSASLLNLATGRRLFAGMPLAFDEGDPTGRVRNLAKWKKPALWVVLICIVLCSILAVCLITDPKTDPAPESISFEDITAETVTMVELKNLHNGEYTYLIDPSDIVSVCNYLSDLSGTYLGSGKGFYEGTYQVRLLQGETVLFSIAFGDSNTFYHGEGDDGYAMRYAPNNIDIPQIVAFFSTYDSSDFQWDFEGAADPTLQVTQNDWGVTIVPDRVSRTGATALFSYSGSIPGEENAELTYGDYLSLERLEDGNWVPVKQLPGYGYLVGDASYPVTDGYGMVHEWPDRFGVLPDGQYRMGKRVTLIRPDGSREERMVYGEFSIPESIITGLIPLEDLPEMYGAEQAMIDGCLVNRDGVATENKELFQEFAENAWRGIPGTIRIFNCHYGDEYQWHVMDLHFDGNVYTLTNLENTYIFRYLKQFTGEKAWEGADHDAFDYYVLVNDDSVTFEDIMSGKLDMSDWENPAHWTVYAEFIYLPKLLQLPDDAMQATLEFQGETMLTVTDPDRLEKIWLLFENAEILGYEPKTHSTGLQLNLILETQTGESVVIDLDLDNDICRIDGEYIFYGAYDEPNYVEKLWDYLGISAWPDAVYQAYPNAYRPL